MASKYISPPKLIPKKYKSWKKEMKLWEMATNIVKTKQAPTVFLTLEDKAREAILEMDLDTLNTENGMKFCMISLMSCIKVMKIRKLFMHLKVLKHIRDQKKCLWKITL